MGNPLPFEAGARLSRVRLDVPILSGGTAPAPPILRAATVQIDAATIAATLDRMIPEVLARFGATGRVAETRLVDGGLVLAVEAQKMITLTVTATLSVTATGDGRVMVEATDLKAGRWIPLNLIVERALGYLQNIPGVRPAGPRAVELDPDTLLAIPAVDVKLPLRWASRVREVRITPAALVVVCAEG
ncbi:MAG: hypothetical protein AVDCRST_MAG73-749 [uncultured Thermomicrobiales bacterium]|uniref:Uncharacterized protein n=1 Tax=uncultured Thermomicrobiales bacterium TaxID=1645740 RepID=A0A6J4TPT1_9BACT|nr:MAG: hypothetical protein AVDCRST_MAG73-749 [uncultured Thermomicrobiales bacterium]